MAVAPSAWADCTERRHPSSTAGDSRKKPGSAPAGNGRFMRRYVGLAAECVTSCQTFIVYSSDGGVIASHRRITSSRGGS
jgi:hypothetical protein